MSGTVMISRDLFDHCAFRDAPFSEREAWLWIIMEAAWKPRQRRIGHIVISIDRGQLAVSVRFMADAWGWTAAKVQRYVERLKKLEMISAETDTGLTVITVCNYDKFQTKAKASDTGPIQDRYRTDTNEKKEVIREEGKEVEREANASPKTKRGSRLSPDWFLPMEWGEWAVSQGLDPGTIRSEADRFRDYWCAKPGQHGVKLDWQATWRNWIRSAKDRGNANRNARQIPQGGKRADPALEQILRLTGLSQASVNGGGGTGSLGEEDGSFRLGT